LAVPDEAVRELTALSGVVLGAGGPPVEAVVGRLPLASDPLAARVGDALTDVLGGALDRASDARRRHRAPPPRRGPNRLSGGVYGLPPRQRHCRRS
jgi:hypothetical protein